MQMIAIYFLINWSFQTEDWLFKRIISSDDSKNFTTHEKAVYKIVHLNFNRSVLHLQLTALQVIDSTQLQLSYFTFSAYSCPGNRTCRSILCNVIVLCRLYNFPAFTFCCFLGIQPGHDQVRWLCLILEPLVVVRGTETHQTLQQTLSLTQQMKY